jgi:hypothetical protein
MITVEDIESTWALLEGSEPEPSELRVREIDELRTPLGRPLFAVDADRRRHLLIPIAPKVKIREDKRSGGIHVTAHRLLDSEKPCSFIDVVCRKPHLNRLFSIIINETANLLIESPSRPDLICQQVLNRWRELLEKEPSKRPDLQVVTGLFGELWQLREVVRCNPDSLGCWVGPTGAKHDLFTERASLEVKTSLIRHGRFYTIHGHEQLEPLLNSELYLAAMKLEQAAGGGETISSLVDSMVSLGGDQHLLLTLLSKIGITPHVIEACDDLCFLVAEDRIYRVDEEFPRITSGSFKGGSLPNGVLMLEYQIDLSAEPPFPLSSSEIAAVYKLLAYEAG